jgi:hypothetical protein
MNHYIRRMAKIFDVGPLPQIAPPTILDTQPLIPFDLNHMAQAANQKSQIDMQRQQMDLHYLAKFSDDLEGLLKSPDGSFLSPISKFHQKTFQDVASQTDSAVEAMSKAIELGDYKGAYRNMFEAKTQIKNNTDYKRTLQELSLFKDRLGEKDLDPYAINSLYEDLGKADKEFDLNRFNRSELTLFDAPEALKSYTTAIAPQEATVYEAFKTGGMSEQDEMAYMRGEVKYQVQQSPDEIKQGLRDLISTNPAYAKHLQNRGIDIDKYIESSLSSHLLTNKPGAEYIYQKDTETGKDRIVGIKRVMGYEGVTSLAKDAADIAKAKKDAQGEAGYYDNLLNGPTKSTQQVMIATPEVVDFPSFRTAFRNSYESYANVSQQVDTMLANKTIHGLVTDTPNDRVADLVATVSSLGIEEAKRRIKITDKDGTVDEASELRFFEKTLPQAIEAFANKQIYLRGNERLLEGSYDKIKKEYLKNGSEDIFGQLGIQQGPKGEAIFPEDFDLDKRDQEYTQVQGDRGVTSVKNPLAAEKNKLRDAHAKVVDKALVERYENYFKPDADILRVWQLPQEAGQDYAPMRLQADWVVEDLINDDASFYSADSKLNKGLPMTLSHFNKTSPPVGIDKKNSWDNVDISGFGVDAETGQFFMYGFPRANISADEMKEYQGNKGNTAFTEQVTEESGGKTYLRSKKAMVIPWNNFGTDFYDAFLRKFGSYEGLYKSLVDGMEEKVPEGQPVKINIGGHLLFITPKGPIGENPSKLYQITVPPEVATHVENGGLPEGVTSNVTPTVSTKNFIEAPKPIATPEVKAQAAESMGKTIEDKPWLDFISTMPPVESQIETENKVLGNTNDELIQLYPHLKDVITGKDTGGVIPKGPLAPAKQGPLDGLLSAAEASTRVYEGSKSGLNEILTKGANYITTLDPENKAKLLNPSNFTSLEFKANRFDTNKPINVTEKTAAALAHYNDFIGRNFPDSKSLVTDTFRTSSQNKGTPGSGTNSKHKVGKAIDISLKGPGKEIYDRYKKARTQEEKDELLIDMFGTKNVSFEYHTSGTGPHLHVEIN